MNEIVLSVEGKPAELLHSISVMGEAEAQQARLQLGLEALSLHGKLLSASIELERLGYDPAVEVPAALAIPHIVGAEIIFGLAQARKLAKRELDLHPDDETKRIIIARKYAILEHI